MFVHVLLLLLSSSATAGGGGAVAIVVIVVTLLFCCLSLSTRSKPFLYISICCYRCDNIFNQNKMITTQ